MFDNYPPGYVEPPTWEEYEQEAVPENVRFIFTLKMSIYTFRPFNLQAWNFSRKRSLRSSIQKRRAGAILNINCRSCR